MSASQTTIPLPSSLTSTTPQLPTATQRALISHLQSTSAIPDLSTLLADSLARTGWTDRVRALSLELLRNGSCDTFPELLEEVMRRAKIPRDANSNTNGSSAPSSSAAAAGKAEGQAGASAANGTSTPTTAPQGSQGAIVVSKEWSGGPDGLPDVRIPATTVEAGVTFLKEKIRDVVEVDADEEAG
jgi:hypothetical protein